MRTLLIVAVPAVIASLYRYLEARGHELDAASRGDSAIRLARENPYDIVVLGPGVAGMHNVCAQLKQTPGGHAAAPMPVLMLGETGSEQEMLAAFASGADDFVPLSCDPAEVEARLASHVRRAQGAVCRARVLRVGPVTLDVETYTVLRSGGRIDLTRTGFLLLETLMRAAPRVVGRAELIRTVWRDQPPETDALRVHIHLLRQALDKPFAVPMLRTVPRIGYQLCFAAG